MSNIPPVILSTAGYKHSYYLLVSCEPSSLFPSSGLFPALCIALYSLGWAGLNDHWCPDNHLAQTTRGVGAEQTGGGHGTGIDVQISLGPGNPISHQPPITATISGYIRIRTQWIYLYLQSPPL